MEKITIAIPVYNVEKFVERALLSALNQTHPNIEILAIDDKGSDNSMDIVRRIKEVHPRGEAIRILEHTHNRGTGATRNSAIDEAAGAYLMYLDSDDEITSDCLEIHYMAVKKIDADYSAALHEQIKKDGEVILHGTSRHNIKLENKDQIKAYYFKKNYWNAVYPWNKLYKLAFLRENKIRCIDHHINEDIILTFLTKINANKVVLIPNHTYKYYFTAGSTMDKLRSGKEVARFMTQLEEIVDFKLSYSFRFVEKHDLDAVLDDILRDFLDMVGDLKPYMSKGDFQDVKKIYQRLICETKGFRLNKSMLFWAFVLVHCPIILFRLGSRLKDLLFIY